MSTDYRIDMASSEHLAQADAICQPMKLSAANRGTGIAGRSPDCIRQKMRTGTVIIATLPDGQWVGFMYLDVWENGRFVFQSGLIVDPAYRHQGVARRLKHALFTLSRQLLPDAKLFSITTGQVVMELNREPGFRPVAFSELPHDPQFWQQCATCRNCASLARTDGKYGRCTGMLFDSAIPAADGCA